MPAMASGQLHRQLLHNGFVGHHVEHDLGVRVLRFEALGHVGVDAAVAIDDAVYLRCRDVDALGELRM